MVQISKVLFYAARKAPRAHFRPTFLDTLRLTVKGGHGGNGVPKYGGVGGQGGCIYLIAKEDITLRNVVKKHPTKRVIASAGEDSAKHRIMGFRGADIQIPVPVGVEVYDDKGKLLADLDHESATCLAAGGGLGGCSGNSFLGRPGESRVIKLDMKMIADVGLVGFPNAGKSTFLKAVSKASPKIASYPFTTICPQIGVVEYPDYRQVSIADLPGLIEGAHANIGMGHKFLKHVERTRLLLMIVDIFGFQLSQSHLKRNCLQNIFALNKELELYDSELLNKPCILLLNKMDKEDSNNEFQKFKDQIFDLSSGLNNCPQELQPEKLLNFERIITMSAKDGVRIQDIKTEIRNVLDEAAEREIVTDGQEKNSKEKFRERGPIIT